MFGSQVDTGVAGKLRKVRVVALGAVLTLAVATTGIAQGDEGSEKSQELLKQVRKARVIDLSHTWEIQSPIASVNPSYSFSLSATHANKIGRAHV